MDKRYIARCWIEEWATEKDVADMVARLAEAGFMADVVPGNWSSRILRVRVWEDEIDAFKLVVRAACCKAVKGKMTRAVFGSVIDPEVA